MQGGMHIRLTEWGTLIILFVVDKEMLVNSLFLSRKQGANY